MKKSCIQLLTIFVLSGSLFLFASGCSKKTVVPPITSPNGSMSSDMSGGTDINYPRYNEENLPAEGSLDDKSRGGMTDAMDQQSDEYKRLHGRSSANLAPVFFDFDQAGVRSDMTEVLFHNAEYLKSVANATIVLEGNCDDRGTNEYNLALGERRAINVLQYLVNLGIDARRMRTLSYGEEKPLFLGQDEESYSMNRRVDFVIK
jgi:peptidoglycan-associated lipoprotein